MLSFDDIFYAQSLKDQREDDSQTAVGYQENSQPSVDHSKQETVSVVVLLIVFSIILISMVFMIVSDKVGRRVG